MPEEKDKKDLTPKGQFKEDNGIYTKEDREKERENVKSILAKLEDGLKAVFESDNYKNYLNTMSKFHNYSINNTLLINQQKPDATFVAGFNSWAHNFDRHVKKGEKGIRIIAPAPYYLKKEQQVVDPVTGQGIFNPDGTPKTAEVEVKIPAFKVTYVYDVSQTYGKELPSLGVSELLGEVDKAEDFIDSLKKVSPVPIEFGETNGDSKGFYSPDQGKIVVKDGMADSQTIKTMVHEISHAKLHNPEMAKENAKKSKGTIEMEAESVAYIVCQHFGIDTSDYSLAYIAGWSEGKGIDELRASMETIRDTAGEMINRVEGNLRNIERESQKEVSTPEKEPPKEERKSVKEKLAEKKKELAQKKNEKKQVLNKDGKGERE